MEMFGTTKDDRLGAYVTGIPAGTNLPFRAAIFRAGYTLFYRLQNSTDTTVVLKLKGQKATIGDLNGDGLLDIAVVTPADSIAFDTVFVYWGNSVGVDVARPTRIIAENYGDDFGYSITIGQIIGDATRDLVITAPGYPHGLIQGKVYIYEGGSSFGSIPKAVMTGDASRYMLGNASAIGDLNNDGYNDLAILGSYQSGSERERWHYVDIWFGKPIFSTQRNLRFQAQYGLIRDMKIFDVNGDHLPDLLWTGLDSMYTVYVHFGNPNLNPIPDLKLINPGVNDFGVTIANAGDMNGDGFDDIAIGCADATITAGFVFIFSGGPKIDAKFDAAVGISAQSFFGSSISALGDINGDGLSDIAVGGPKWDFFNDRGYWGIFKGDSSIPVTAVQENGSRESLLPGAFTLLQCYPNPFNPKTEIRFSIPKDGRARLSIHDLLGKEVRLLADDFLSVGFHKISFDGSGLPSGVYFYRLNFNSSSQTKKMLLTK
jgi:hypothetical protein